VSASPRPRVVVVDDHELFRGGLVGLLGDHGVEVVGEASMAAPGIEIVLERKPDVVLMDLNMPGMSGIEATQRLATAAPHTRIVVLSVVADERNVVEALRAGAFGYLPKDAPIAQIVEAIHAAARGESLIAPRVAGYLVQRLRRAPIEEVADAADLTPRELEILELMARGMGNIEIGKALHLSQHTVKNHVSSVLRKLQVKNRSQAAVRAVRRGLV
jgi:DNA-binding NarL/FixJ family response regulator